MLAAWSVPVALLTICAVAAAADHGANHIKAATSTARCNTYELRVAGDGVDQPKPLVSYNITLAPPSGTPMTIVDSFAITPDADGSFRKTITNSWQAFDFALTGKYTLSGSAVLVSGLTPLSFITITFSPARLTCPMS